MLQGQHSQIYHIHESNESCNIQLTHLNDSRWHLYATPYWQTNPMSSHFLSILDLRFAFAAFLVAASASFLNRAIIPGGGPRFMGSLVFTVLHQQLPPF